MFPGANEVCALMVATAGKAVGVTLVCRPLQACMLPPVISKTGHDVWSSCAGGGDNTGGPHG